MDGTTRKHLLRLARKTEHFKIQEQQPLHFQPILGGDAGEGFHQRFLLLRSSLALLTRHAQGRQSHVLEVLRGDISSFLLRERERDRLADDPSDLPFLPQPSARLVQTHALQDIVAYASYHHVDVTTDGDVVEGLVVRDGRVDGLEDEGHVLLEGLQVADVVEGGLVAHLTVVVGGEEMAVSLHPCRLHEDEELDELGEVTS